VTQKFPTELISVVLAYMASYGGNTCH